MAFIDDDTLEVAAPIVTGLALIAGGALLMRADPEMLKLPKKRPMPAKPVARLRGGEAGPVLVETLRAGATTLVPSNLVMKLGRGLFLAGVGMLVVRLLDWLAGEDSWVE